MHVAHYLIPSMEDISDGSHASPFLRLPPEISTQVLLELQWNELLVAQRVCRAFKALIESSTMQYHIHLAIAGYEDELGSHPIPLLERLNSLKAVQRCFSRMDFPNRTRIELAGYTPTYELQGGVFLQGRHLPHNLNQTIGVNAWSFHDPQEPFAWRLPDLSGPIRDLTLDPAQDLLVLIEGAQPNQPLVLQFLSLATGDRHPLVTEPLRCPEFTRPVSSFGFVVTIIGDLVALLEADVCFFICNWKNGKIYSELDLTSSKDVEDFFFLDEDTFVLTFAHRNQAALKVYKLHRDERRSLESSLVAVFQLPTLTLGTAISIHARSDPPPRSYSPYTSNPRFTTSPYSVRLEDRIIILSLDVVRGAKSRNVILVVRAETLMKVPETALSPGGGAAIVTPEMWMNQTRMLPSIIPLEQWMCYCYGSKMVIPIEGSGLSGPDLDKAKWAKALLLDFNPHLATWVRAGKDGAPWDPSSPQEIYQGSDERFRLEIGEKDEFFEADWVSGLPFTVVTSCHKHDMHRTESVVLMIDDKRMMVLKMKRTGGLRIPVCMDVYTA